MIKGFLVRKKGMTQKFRENGDVVVATICQATPCVVVGLRNDKKDGHVAVQIAAGLKKKANKAFVSWMKKSKVDSIPEIIREVRPTEKGDLPKIGDRMDVGRVIEAGDKVDVVGISKGRGFAGAVKRWGFATQPATHGQKNRQRSPGSIGAQTPGKVIKGKKMPGHFGNTQKTVKNLEVLLVDGEKQEVLLKGSVPGFRNSWLLIKKVGKVKSHVSLRGLKKDKEETKAERVDEQTKEKKLKKLKKKK